VLGEALEACFGVRLTIGPALEEGFYYDCYLGEDRSLGDAEKPVLEKKIEQARLARRGRAWTGSGPRAAERVRAARAGQGVCRSWTSSGCTRGAAGCLISWGKPGQVRVRVPCCAQRSSRTNYRDMHTFQCLKAQAGAAMRCRARRRS